MDGKPDIYGGQMKKLFCLMVSFMLSACSFIRPAPSGFQEVQIETENYLTLNVWEKDTIKKGQILRLYIEGDGNPNPGDKIALYYAEQDPYDNVIYIARPCQWSNDKICKKNPKLYQEQRFHPEILREMEELISYLIRKYQAKGIELIGYDGGGLVAMEIATHIQTKRVITIAGILDLNAYVHYNDVAEMPDAFNPADKLGVLSDIEQIHYVGTLDEITPARVAERFVAKMNNPKSAVVKRVKGVNHTNWKGVALDY